RGFLERLERRAVHGDISAAAARPAPAGGRARPGRDGPRGRGALPLVLRRPPGVLLPLGGGGRRLLSLGACGRRAAAAAARRRDGPRRRRAGAAAVRAAALPAARGDPALGGVPRAASVFRRGSEQAVG